MKVVFLAVVLSSVFPLIPYASTEAIEPNTPILAAVQQSTLINLNKADVDALTQSFKGIGRKRAEAIIAYREANGEFKSIEDLALVKGIGKSFVEKNLQQLQGTYSIE